MARPTVAGNAYRWACPTVERMIRHRPAIAADLLQADAATKHFVALAIRGWELHQGGCERALRQLSEDLFSRPRPAVLAEIWGVGLGKLGFLKRLPGRVLPRAYYDHLVAAWSDRRGRRLLSQLSRLSLARSRPSPWSISRSRPHRLGPSERSAPSCSTTCWPWCGGIGPTSTTWAGSRAARAQAGRGSGGLAAERSGPCRFAAPALAGHRNDCPAQDRRRDQGHRPRVSQLSCGRGLVALRGSRPALFLPGRRARRSGNRLCRL